MTTIQTKAVIDRKALRVHLTEWLKDPKGYSVSIETVATLTNKTVRNLQRDIKRLQVKQEQEVKLCETLTGSDFVTLLASYNTALSVVVVNTLAELYAEQKD